MRSPQRRYVKDFLICVIPFSFVLICHCILPITTNLDRRHKGRARGFVEIFATRVLMQVGVLLQSCMSFTHCLRLALMAHSTQHRTPQEDSEHDFHAAHRHTLTHLIAPNPTGGFTFQLNIAHQHLPSGPPITPPPHFEALPSTIDQEGPPLGRANLLRSGTLLAHICSRPTVTALPMLFPYHGWHGLV